MDLALEGREAERTWLATVGSLVLVLAAGSALFYEQVYAGFLWHYFWGPVYADAHGATCAVWNGGARTLLYSSQACRAASGIVAYPGYTLVSEVGYMVTLLLMLSGVVLLLDRLEVGENRGFFYALFPFMFLGGALRVVEDANDAFDMTLVPYPWNAAIISPFIYFTMFAVTLVALVGSVALARRGVVDRYERPLFAAGTGLLALTVGWLAYLSVATARVEFHPIILVVVLALATGAALATWRVAVEYLPELREGTGYIGLLVVWAHAVDGAANVVGLDWGAELGLQYDLVPKHPVNAAIVDITAGLLPASVTQVTGDAWPFLLVKLAVAVGAVWLFNEDLREESPRFTMLMLVAIVAVGLGPGTRDMLRATFGV